MARVESAESGLSPARPNACFAYREEGTMRPAAKMLAEIPVTYAEDSPPTPRWRPKRHPAVVREDDEVTAVIPAEFLERLRAQSKAYAAMRPPAPNVDIIELAPEDAVLIDPRSTPCDDACDELDVDLDPPFS